MYDRQIANIIYRELFSFNTVLLQNVGILSLVHHCASLSRDGSSLRPPYRTVSLEPVSDANLAKGTVDLVMALSLSTGMDYTSAYSAYNSYIMSNRSGKILRLPFVMSIDISSLSITDIDSRLRNTLENQNLDPVPLMQLADRPQSRPMTPGMPPQGRNVRLSSFPGTVETVLAALAAAVAVGFLAYTFLLPVLRDYMLV